MMTSHFFRYFLFLGQRGPSKVCSVGTRWMRNQIPHPMSSHDRNLSKNTMRYVENMNKKSSFLMTNMSIQPLWLTYFIEILLVLEFQLTKTNFGTFSYKAHFRPQISSNDITCKKRPSLACTHPYLLCSIYCTLSSFDLTQPLRFQRFKPSQWQAICGSFECSLELVYPIIV